MISKRFSSPAAVASSPGGGVYVNVYSGKIYTQFDFWAFGGEIRTSNSTLASITTSARGAYFYFPESVTIDRTGLAVATAVAGQTAKIGWYELDNDGVAQDLLFETAELDCSSTGEKLATVSYTFSKGLYLPAISATSTSIAVTGLSFSANYTPKTFLGESSIGSTIRYGMQFTHASGSPGSMTAFPANAASAFISQFSAAGAAVLTLVGVRAA